MPIALLLLCAISAIAQQHSYSPADIEAGALLYREHCAVCHGQDGELISGVNLRRGQFRRGNSDDDLMQVISRGVPGTAMPPHNFTNPQLWSLVAFVRTMREFQDGPISAGDASRGLKLLEGKGGCLACHRVGDKGSRLGPDLTEIGIIRPRSHLERSVLEPNESILPQHRSVRAVTRDGTVVIGRRLNEDTHTVQILDAKEQLLSLSKDGLKEYGTMKTSPMPSYRGKFTAQELADIVQYLASLKGSRN
jgi:putative heme-binding domain-containing protein